MTNTVADFWQMVWEQGSVVIVMLLKLSEISALFMLLARGLRTILHFEVHLVSEHVWCEEDYLVQVLYLIKNKTGRTRTAVPSSSTCPGQMATSPPPSPSKSQTESQLESYRGDFMAP